MFSNLEDIIHEDSDTEEFETSDPDCEPGGCGTCAGRFNCSFKGGYNMLRDYESSDGHSRWAHLKRYDIPKSSKPEGHQQVLKIQQMLPFRFKCSNAQFPTYSEAESRQRIFRFIGARGY